MLPLEALPVDPPLQAFITEFELSILISLHRDLLGTSHRPLRAQLHCAAPKDAAVYPNMFGCPLIFGKSTAALTYDSSSLGGAPYFANDIAHAELATLCDDLLEEFRLRLGIAGRVR